MKTGGRIALGVGAGYLLGRTRKMRLALMIAAAGATGTVGSPRQLVQRGLKQLASSQELGKLTEVARGELMNAAKAAAVTAASSRIDSFSERLQSGGLANGLGKARHRQEPSQGSTEEDTEENAGADSDENTRDEDQDTPARGRNRRQPAKRTTRRESAADAGDEEPGDERERSATRKRTPARTATRRRSPEEAEDTSPRRSSRTRTSSTRTPVRRTGR